jgi:hypothetical protein
MRNMNSLLRSARMHHSSRNCANATEIARRSYASRGLNPTLRERAAALARERGEVRTAELTEIGIPRCYLSRMCDEGVLVKVAYGR